MHGPELEPQLRARRDPDLVRQGAAPAAPAPAVRKQERGRRAHDREGRRRAARLRALSRGACGCEQAQGRRADPGDRRLHGSAGGGVEVDLGDERSTWVFVRFFTSLDSSEFDGLRFIEEFKQEKGLAIMMNSLNLLLAKK